VRTGARTHIHNMCACVKKPTPVSRLLRPRAIRVLVVCVYNKCVQVSHMVYIYICVCVCVWTCVCVLVMYWICFDIRTNEINIKITYLLLQLPVDHYSIAEYIIYYNTSVGYKIATAIAADCTSKTYLSIIIDLLYSITTPHTQTNVQCYIVTIRVTV
jgi:hypothetical protein